MKKIFQLFYKFIIIPFSSGYLFIKLQMLHLSGNNPDSPFPLAGAKGRGRGQTGVPRRDGVCDVMGAGASSREFLKLNSSVWI